MLPQGIAVSSEKELEGEKPGARQSGSRYAAKPPRRHIDYTPHGYTAREIAAAIESHGNRKVIAGLGQLDPLGQILASDLLECPLGIQCLYYDQRGEHFVVDQFEHDVGVIDTTISIRGDSYQDKIRQKS